MRLSSILLSLATLVSFVGIPLPEFNPISLRFKNYSFSLPVLAQTPEERKVQADQLLEQGIQQFNTSEFQAAIASWQQALNLYREINDRDGESLALNNLGLIYYSLSEYRTAIDYHQQLLLLARENQDRTTEAITLANLGEAYLSLGDYTTAITTYQELLTLARQIGDRPLERMALDNLGISYLTMKDYHKAIPYYQELLAMTQEIGDRTGEGIALDNLGIAYDSLGEYSTAIQYHQQRLAIAQSLSDRRGEAATLGNLGASYLSLGDYQTAIEYHQQLLAIARELGDRTAESIALDYLGIATLNLGDAESAIQYQQQHLALARSNQDHTGEGIALNNLGLALLNSRRFAEAESTLRQAIEVWENLRHPLGNNDSWNLSVFEQQTNTYRLLQEVLISQNQPESALLIAERGRGRAFVELMSRRLNSESNLNTKITLPTLENIKEIAKTQNAVLVEYSLIFNQFLYIWVIQPTGEIAFRSVNLSESESPLADAVQRGHIAAATGRLRGTQGTDTLFTEIVRNTRASISNTTGAIASGTNLPEPTQRNLQELYQLLIEPIADLLPTDPNQSVIFIPQDSLFLVPFAALQDKNGNYLIEKHTILTVPAIQVLELTQQQPVNEDGEILIVGNPTMPKVSLGPNQAPQQLPSLAGTEEEARAIASLLNTDFLSGDRATETLVKQKMPGAKLIHLATHGLLEQTDNGLLAAIALTPSSNDDGLLTPNEILSLDLNADLVVLSACDTGRGKITGDGVVGLSRSILTAGARSAIVSLWKVPDAQTSTLMSEFYRQWQQTGNKAQALRQAMLTTMEQYPHPMNWAAFTIMGESD